MTDQLSKLAARLREMAHDIPDTFSQWDAADLDAAADLIDNMAKAEPVAARYNFDGHGWLYIDNGSGSDWPTRYSDAEPLYTLPLED